MSERRRLIEVDFITSPEERAKSVIDHLMLLIAQEVGWEPDDPPELLDALLNREFDATFRLLYQDLTVFIRNTRMSKRKGGGA